MVAVVPEPPLLVPELATGATVETAALRAACREAAHRLAAPRRRGSRSARTPAAAGRCRPTRGGASSGSVSRPSWSASERRTPRARSIPLCRCPLLIAGWLRDGLAVTVRGELVAPDADPPRVVATRRARSPREDVALLVVGDGAATHTEKAPGYLDERAGPFDDVVAVALARRRPGRPRRPRPRRSPPSCGRRAARRGRCWRARPAAARGRASCCTRRGRSASATTWRCGSDAADRRRRPDRDGQVRPRPWPSPAPTTARSSTPTPCSSTAAWTSAPPRRPPPSAPSCPTTSSTSST